MATKACGLLLIFSSLLWADPDSLSDYQALKNSQTYYVSATLGDDSRPDSIAQNPLTPWKTLVRASQHAFKPGDALLLKKGETFSGGLTLQNLAGTPSKPILIGSYGTGANPILTGEDSISGWISQGSNNWMAAFSQPVKDLYINGSEATLSSYPANGFLTIDSVYSPMQFSVKGAIPIGIVGATANVQTVTWCIDARKIAALNSRTISVASKPNYPFSKGQSLFINNTRAALNNENQWMYDSSSQQVWLHSSSTPTKITAMVQTSGIYVNKSKFMIIRDLTIKRFAQQGIYVSGNSSNIQIKNTSIHQIGTSGIQIDNGDSIVVAYSSIQDCFIRGIISGAPNTQIHHCTIKRIGLQTNVMSGVGQDGGDGIQSNGRNSQIYNNRLDSLGYIGIDFRAPSHKIFENVISDYCLALNDGGGIYTWSPSYSTVSADSSIIKQNIVYLRTPTNKPVEGIYLDDRSKMCSVLNNTVIGTYMGIYLHNGENHIVRENLIVNPSRMGIYLNEDSSMLDQMFGNQVIHNQVYVNSVNANTTVLRKSMDTHLIGVLDSNQYFTTWGNTPYSIVDLKSGYSELMTLKHWRSFGYDSTSQLTIVTDKGPQESNLIQNGDMTNGIKGWGAWPSSSVLSWKSFNPELDAPTLHVHLSYSQGTTGLLKSNSFSLTQGNRYLLSLQIAGATPGRVRIVVLKNGGDYSSMGVNQDIWFDNDSLVIPFVATATNSNVRLDLDASAQTPEFDITHASLIPKYAVSFSIVWNENNQDSTIDLPSNSTNVFGNSMPSKFVLKPYKAKVILMPTSTESSNASSNRSNNYLFY